MRPVPLLPLLCLSVLLGCAAAPRPAPLRASAPGDARRWLRQTHDALAPLLPPGRRALTTEELGALGRAPRRLYEHFRQDPAALTSPLRNARGLYYTSVAAAGDATDGAGAAEPAPWGGFRSVWVPAAEGLRLFGRLGCQETDADAILIAVGLFGDLDGHRYRDLSRALRARGHHVLALEMRGHGRTGAAHPGAPLTFGVLEAVDLLSAAAWVRGACPTRRVGLIGFSWGALDAVLAAWLDGDPGTSDPRDPIGRRLPAPGARPAFDAGVLALSPVLDLVDLGERYERRAAFLSDPARYLIQKTIARYLERRGGPQDHRVWPLVRFELARSAFGLEYGDAARTLRRSLRHLRLTGAEGAAKLERVRVPLLIVHAADDPVAPAHPLGELAARVRNENVSTLLLPGSGHIGLAAQAPGYYEALIARFFDAAQGPTAARRGGAADELAQAHRIGASGDDAARGEGAAR